jgi:hypothetical protein
MYMIFLYGCLFAYDTEWSVPSLCMAALQNADCPLVKSLILFDPYIYKVIE